MVAWERPGAPALSRMWATARAATVSGEPFFELLPDGPVGPAFRFAVAVEIIAALGFAASMLPLVLVLAPAWARHVVMDAPARAIFLRIGIVALPSLALLLVAAHAAHGLAVDHGARGAHAPGARRRALRFGLYASGWDLVLGPVGVVVLVVKEGLGSARALMRLGVGLPGRCARAFLRGAYHLDGERAARASRLASFVAIVATLVGAAAILAGAVVLILATG